MNLDAEGIVVRPGDKLIIRVPLSTTHEDFDAITEAISDRLPDVETLLIRSDQILVYRPGDEP